MIYINYTTGNNISYYKKCFLRTSAPVVWITFRNLKKKFSLVIHERSRAKFNEFETHQPCMRDRCTGFFFAAEVRPTLTWVLETQVTYM